MFHGSFAKKTDAVAKERKTKGAWVKSVLTNQGYRHIVMSPRTNPRKMKPKVPKVNPSELLVMGANPQRECPRCHRMQDPINAGVGPGGMQEWECRNCQHRWREFRGNPHTHEITAKPGETITIRVNPTAVATRENLYFGFGPSEPSRKDLAASRREFKARVRRKTKEERAELSRLRRSARSGFRGKRKLQDLFHEVYGANPNAVVCGARIGGEICTRKPGHRGPHLPQGATMRTRERLPHSWKPRENPSAAALREAFTGKDADSFTVHRETHMPAGDYAQLGKLLALYVKPYSGGQVQMIKPHDVLLVADESARQLWFVGGDQDITAALGVFGARQRGAGLFELGEARRIDYRQRKEHVAHPEQDSWRHEFGEESGVRPVVLFDAANKRLLLEGGEYVVRAEGIVN